MWGGRVSNGTASSPYIQARGGAPESSKLLEPPTYAHAVWHTTKFCLVIKLNEREILQGLPRPRPAKQMLTRELFAVADLVVLVHYIFVLSCVCSASAVRSRSVSTPLSSSCFIFNMNVTFIHCDILSILFAKCCKFPKAMQVGAEFCW